MNRQRIDKIISTQLNISRTAARSGIRKGAVTVDGQVLCDPSENVDPKNSQICFRGQAITFKEFIYIVMNKPKGVLSASNDKKRETVVDLVPQALRRSGIAPVGRLDKDTVGLLLLTDDGQFAHKAISPKSNIKKLYEVLLDGPITPTCAEEFKKGIVLADGTKCLPARLTQLDQNRTQVEISEGKYHQIKRMFGVVGLGVVELKRLKIGEFCLPEDLSEGECRELTENELSLILPKNP